MDAPIPAAYREQMTELARAVDTLFNGNKKGNQRKVAFVILLAEFGDNKRLNYISNAERADVIAMMKEFIARNEGQPLTPGHG